MWVPIWCRKAFFQFYLLSFLDIIQRRRIVHFYLNVSQRPLQPHHFFALKQHKYIYIIHSTRSGSKPQRLLFWTTKYKFLCRRNIGPKEFIKFARSKVLLRPDVSLCGHTLVMSPCHRWRRTNTPHCAFLIHSYTVFKIQRKYAQTR